MNKVNEDSIIKIMGLEKGSTKLFTATEMRNFARNDFKIKNKDYMIRSTPTLLKYLERNGCKWNKMRKRIGGRNLWCYDITLT